MTSPKDSPAFFRNRVKPSPHDKPPPPDCPTYANDGAQFFPLIIKAPRSLFPDATDKPGTTFAKE